MIRHALTVAALAGCALCASCATNQKTQTAEAPAAPAALEGANNITLRIGDPAPPLAIGHWVKGEPIEEFEEGKVYVVEFWATWCGPCRASMPHISDLQEKYADYNVQVVGITDEPLEKVTEFLNSEDSEGVTWNDKMRYTVAILKDGTVFDNAYMSASGQRGIPTSFIVGKEGRIEWIGHPTRLDDALHDVVHDQWDREAAVQAALRQEEAQRAAIARRREMAQAREQGNWEKVLAMHDEDIERSGGNPGMMMQKFITLIADVKTFHVGYAYGEKIVNKAWDDPFLLNQVAWFVADDPRVEKRDLAFALRTAERANELTESQNPAILDTLARVYYELGEQEEAIKWQRLAVEHAPDNQMGEGIRETLKKYETETASGEL